MAICSIKQGTGISTSAESAVENDITLRRFKSIDHF